MRICVYVYVYIYIHRERERCIHILWSWENAACMSANARTPRGGLTIFSTTYIPEYSLDKLITK